MLLITALQRSTLESQKLIAKRPSCLRLLQLCMTVLPTQHSKSLLVCASNIEINIMNIVRYLRASKQIRAMRMTGGFGDCSNAARRPLLANILGGVSIEKCNRLNSVKMPNTGSLS
jgi:hypothetical protein